MKTHAHKHKKKIRLRNTKKPFFFLLQVCTSYMIAKHHNNKKRGK